VAAPAVLVELAALRRVLGACHLSNLQPVSLTAAGLWELAQEVRQFSRNLAEVRELVVNQAVMGFQRLVFLAGVVAEMVEAEIHQLWHLAAHPEPPV
jgi:hypothetical protein